MSSVDDEEIEMTRRTVDDITAREILDWIKNNKPGPDQMGGGNWVAAKNWVESAIKELIR